MAVEIPVVVDIDKAFADAAKKVPGASASLRKAIDDLNSDLELFRGRLNDSSVGTKNFELAAKNVMKLEEAMDLLNSKVNEFTTRTGSVRRLSGDLQVIQRQFERMGASQMFDASGNLSADAKKLQDDYARVAQHLDRVRSILTEEYEAQVMARQEAERQAKVTKERYDAINGYTNTLDSLNARMAALRAEMANVDMYTSPERFKTFAEAIEFTARRMAQLNEQQKILGTKTGSIDQLSAKLQALSSEYNSLSEYERKYGDRAKVIKSEYIAITKELEKESGALQKAARLEVERESAARKKANTLKAENAILATTQKTMRGLQEQERILSERLSKATIGTNKYRQLQKDLSNVRLEMQKASGAVTTMNNGLRNQSLIFSNLNSMASMYFSLFGVLRFVKQIRDVTGELEYQRVALGRLIQDEEYGAQLFERIKAAAVESPFRIKDLVTYTKQLAAYRIEQESLFDTTQRLADISAGLGVDMNRLILAYGQVRAASVLRGQELRQFTEAGIPLVDLLADKFSELKGELVSSADVFKLISERAVPFSMISEIFEDLTDKGGQFYKMQETQAKTLTGRWEKLKDTYDIALQSIGETSTFETYNDIVLGTLNLLAKNLRAIPKLIEGVSWAWASYNAALLLTGSRTKKQISYQVALAASQKTDATRIGRLTVAVLGEAKARDLLTKVYAKQAVATNALSRGFWKLTAAMLANPISAVIAGATALIAIFTSFNKKIKDTTYEFESLEKAVELMSNANKEFSKTDTLITRYERLASKTERTANENLKLSETMNRLREQFPEMADAIDLENGKLEEQVDLLRHANKERLEEARNSAKQELELREKEYEDLMASVDKAQKEYNDKYKSFIQARSKREAGAAAANVSSYGTGYLVTDKQLKAAESAADKAALQAKTNLDELTEKATKLLGIITRLRNQIDPQSQEKDWAEWQNQVKSLQERMMKLGDSPVFTNEEIGNMTSVYDLFGKLKKRIKDLEESIKGMREALSTMKPGDAYNKMEADIKAGEATLAMANAIKALFGFDFSTSKKSGTYTQDPFIKQLQERMKFMKDFQKGYEDLRKYMSSAAAEEKESEIMLTRGLSLGIDPAEQKRAARDLSKWYENTYTAAFDYLKKNKGVTGTMQEFLSKQITGNTNRDKMLKDFQSLIQSLFDAKTDFDTSQITKNIEESLKRVTDEIKRSETARNFYQDILGLTGDEDLATTMTVSVYGDVGEDFKDRIKKQLVDSLSSLDAQSFAGLDDAVRNAFDEGDYEYLVKNLDKVPEKLRDVVKQVASDAEKYNADLFKNFASLVSKYGSSAQKIATIRAKAENEINKIKKALVLSLKDTGLTDWQINDFLSDSFDEDFFAALPDSVRKAVEETREIIKSLRGQMDLDVFKESDDYIKFFAEINVMTIEQASTVRGKLRQAYLKAFHDGSITADELRKNLRAIDTQFKKLSESTSIFGAYLSGGFEKANEKLQEYSNNISVLAEKMKSGKELDQGEQAYASRMLQMFGSGETANIKSYGDLISKFQDSGGLEKAGEAFGQMGEGMSAMASNGPGALAIVDAIIKAVNSTITGLQQIIDQINEVRSEDKKIGEWFRYISDFNQYAYSGWEKLKSGDVIGAATDTVSSLISIYNNIKKSFNKKYDEDIKEQSELIEELEYSYSRLNTTIQKTFGQDYIHNYNKQMEILQAQADAYRKQAEAERAKGKSADEETAKGYEKSARDVENTMEGMRSQLAEFFAGTDVASAAKDFASAWIEAYKQFGSTTDAMSEKFNEMIENMVVNSLAAALIQDILDPVFEAISKASEDGELSAQDIGAISAMLPERMKLINDSMNTLMSEVTAAGTDLRQQAGQFTGISRNIAGASEESITGLAAGINTQNFYISHIDATVTAILSAMTGGSVVTNEGANGAVTNPYQTEMLQHASHIPTIDQNLSDLLSEVRKVIKPRGTAATHYVATNL